MGFLKFLKRDKKKDFAMDELDAPPLPPDMKNMDFQDSMPDIPDIEGMPDLDGPMPKDWPKEEFENPVEKEKFEIPRPMPDFPIENKLPEPPKFGSLRSIRDVPKESEPFAAPKFDFKPRQQEMPDYEEPIEPRPVRDYAQKAEKEAVREERDLISHKDATGKTYIRMDRFRSILMDINEIKGDIKNAASSIEKMQGIDRNKEAEFEKWKANMNDLQKKIIFVDKTLFK